MNHFISDKNTPIGNISIKPFEIERDIKQLHHWVTQPYAKYWGLLDASLENVTAEYQSLLKQSGNFIFMGLVNHKPAFLLEVYEPEHSELANINTVKQDDRGMHILIAPPDEKQHGFSFQVICQAMQFIFDHFNTDRIVVEPDSSNTKIHKLNRRVGFVHDREIQLKSKNAYLAFCTKKQFQLAINKAKADRQVFSRFYSTPVNACDMVQPEVWRKVNRHLVCKAISEFSHERILQPKCIGEHETYQRFQLTSQTDDVVYHFNANLLALEHWSIDADSIKRYQNNHPVDLDAVDFILEFNDQLGIPEDKLATYLEEISSTLYGAAYKQVKSWKDSRELVHADFQTIESNMSEGHPCFIANNGRIGFDAMDYQQYAPESAQSVRFVWLAIHKERSVFSHNQQWPYQKLLESELDPTLISSFNKTIMQQSADPKNYYFIPVHPWQWFHKLSMIFANDIATGFIICLGNGNDVYQAQQSIRTFFNLSCPHRHYVKTALSILNMGFMRGLSSDYMAVTPKINDWVYELVEQDKFLQQTSFTILREVAAIGYRNPHYESNKVGQTQYKKMLSALWRESPVTKVKPDQQLMTMAALLHTDPQGNALLPELIKQSGLTVQQWLHQYFNAYLVPLLHCLYKHHLVFMPHGENIILVMDKGRPVKAIMKDIGEEVCLINSDTELPQGIERIKATMPNDIAILSIFTDVFDDVFRFMAAILVEHCAISEDDFWQQVAISIHQYQASMPELSHRFKELDVFADSFNHSCLNRLQLRNNLQMVNLSDPAGALQFAGELVNPIAKYRSIKQDNKLSITKVAVKSNDQFDRSTSVA